MVRPIDGAGPRPRPARWLGNIFYSVCVWHEPIMLAFSRLYGLNQQSSGASGMDVTVVVAVSAPPRGWAAP